MSYKPAYNLHWPDERSHCCLYFNHSKKANLNKCGDLVTNTTAISKYLPTLDSEINVGLMFTNYEFFQGSTVFLEGPTFIAFSITIRNKNNSTFWLKDLKFFPNCPCPTVIQGPMFILFNKFFRPYIYSLPGLYSTLKR